MSANITERLSGAVVTHRGGSLHVVLSDGQEFWVRASTAAALVSALLADGEVHAEWSHGRESIQAELLAALEAALADPSFLALNHETGRLVLAAIAKARGGK